MYEKFGYEVGSRSTSSKPPGSQTISNMEFPVEIVFYVPGEAQSTSVIAHDSREYAEIMEIYVRTYKSEQ